MSWSFYGVGKPKAVAAKARKDLSAYKCMEPEETVKAKVADIIDVCLSAFPDASSVQIEASGSQSTDSTKPGTATNQLSIKILPLYGFIEE